MLCPHGAAWLTDAWELQCAPGTLPTLCWGRGNGRDYLLRIRITLGADVCAFPLSGWFIGGGFGTKSWMAVPLRGGCHSSIMPNVMLGVTCGWVGCLKSSSHCNSVLTCTISHAAHYLWNMSLYHTDEETILAHMGLSLLCTSLWLFFSSTFGSILYIWLPYNTLHYNFTCLDMVLWFYL